MSSLKSHKKRIFKDKLPRVPSVANLSTALLYFCQTIQQIYALAPPNFLNLKSQDFLIFLCPVTQISTMATHKPYTPVIIIGAGFSGLITACQLQRKLNLTDYTIYERSNDYGGTWSANTCKYSNLQSPSYFSKPQLTCSTYRSRLRRRHPRNPLQHLLPPQRLLFATLSRTSRNPVVHPLCRKEI